MDEQKPYVPVELKNHNTAIFRCDDWNGFMLQVFRAEDSDYHLSIMPDMTSEQFSNMKEMAAEYAAHAGSIRIRMPLVGGGAHDELWTAISAVFKKLYDLEKKAKKEKDK